jgi:hypothetical protein
VQIVGTFLDLVFIQARCTSCSTDGLGIGIVDAAEVPGAAPPTPHLNRAASPLTDRAWVPGAITVADVTTMREFLNTFDGDFLGLLERDAHDRRDPLP